MAISKKTIEKYIELHIAEFGEEIDAKEAEIRFRALLRLIVLISRPLSEQKKKLTRRLDHD